MLIILSYQIRCRGTKSGLLTHFLKPFVNTRPDSFFSNLWLFSTSLAKIKTSHQSVGKWAIKIISDLLNCWDWQHLLSDSLSVLYRSFTACKTKYFCGILGISCPSFIAQWLFQGSWGFFIDWNFVRLIAIPYRFFIHVLWMISHFYKWFCSVCRYE